MPACAVPHEGSLRTRHHIVVTMVVTSIEGRGGRSPSIRELTTRIKIFRRVLDFYAICGTVLRKHNHFCNGALRRRPPTQLPHSVRTPVPRAPTSHMPPPPHHYQIPTLVAYL